MEYTNWLFFIFGMSVMFFSLMSWLFSRRGKDAVSRLMTCVMGLIAAQCFKDVFYMMYVDGHVVHPSPWVDMTGIDMTAEPFYAFILMALCRPGKVRWGLLAIHEIPFIALPVLMAMTRMTIFYDILLAWSLIYGCFYAVWTLIQIPKYHKRLRERFSYMENINLNWLRVIVFSFFIILILWTFVSLTGTTRNQVIYLSGLLTLWMLVGYFINRHESVINELTDETQPYEISGPLVGEETREDAIDAFVKKVEQEFSDGKLYLNPKLKLSDVARAVGSNRTYVSNIFNRVMQTTFYDYVNIHRVNYACHLLETTNDGLDVISLESGFNSMSTFLRAFNKIKGCTPTDYRNQTQEE